ncbi:restriction endonuclease subunit S [Shouchella clausii]|uniref:restriction endonuclease subunit S n=1 Tax=Shouchella clausii TaxID=79880 RepID=UPI00226C71E6|nr:restriction endonuclease subunit S [Shouchella clausii]MCY1104734.1 restriction endonuclease subunit S [Shouchella clausii]
MTKGGRVQNLDNDDKDIPSSWRWIKLKDVLEMQNGLSKRSGKAGTSVPVLRLADIRGNEFGENELRNILLTDKELEKYSLEDNDILFIRVNGSKKSVGKAINYNLGGKMAFCDHLIRARFDIRTIDPLYIVYLFESELIREQLNQKIVSSAGQNTISQGSLNELMLPLPPKQEIDIIVSEIQSLFEKEQMVMSLIEKEINLDTLKQSILSKAFKGQLGTNDPTEENAIELLKEVLQEKL